MFKKIANFVRNKLVYLFGLISLIPKVFNYQTLILLIVNPGKDRIIRLKNGLKFKVSHHLDAHIIKEVFFDKDYEISLSNPKVIIDIGAYLGESCVYYAINYPQAKIYALEPNNESFKKLLFNLKSNKVKNVVPKRLGIGQKSGTSYLYTTPASGLSSIYKNHIQGRTTKKEKIRLTTLTKIMNENNIKKVDLIKMDCEGAEKEILESLSKKIFKQIKNIILEYHDNLEGHDYHDLLILLNDQGYKVSWKQNPDSNNVGLIYASRDFFNTTASRRIPRVSVLEDQPESRKAG